MLAQALAGGPERRLLLAIEAELRSLVEAARARRHAACASTAGGEPQQVAVVLAAGMGGYVRLLVHKTVDRFVGLRSFSIGVGPDRRTLVLADARSASWYGRHHGDCHECALTLWPPWRRSLRHNDHCQPIPGL